MPKTPHLGSKVRALRRRHSLTQVEFARQLGVSSSYVNLIEHNRRPVTANLLIKLARQFKVDVLSFAREDDERLLEHLIECFSDDLFEEDGNMRSGAHLPLAFASARKLSQAAFAPAQSSPICASSAGFQSVKKRPPPWKYRPSSILPSKRK